MVAQQPDAGGAGAIGLLSSPFGAGGFPSITGGQAGPSSASSDSGSGNVGFNNAFSVAGQGGTSNATASPNHSTGTPNYILYGALALLAVVFLRK